MFVTLEKYNIFKNAMGNDYVYNEDIFEKYEEGGMEYEMLKDLNYARKVLDAYCEVERFNIKHPEQKIEHLSDREIEKIAVENEKRWQQFGNYYYEMFRLVMAAHNTFVRHGIKHDELIRLAKIALEI